MKVLLAIPLLLLFAGCAVPLTPVAEKLNIVTAQQKERCTRIKLVTFNQRLGPDKPGNAMRSALNEAAQAGANSFYVISTATDALEGASIVGEALRC